LVLVFLAAAGASEVLPEVGAIGACWLFVDETRQQSVLLARWADPVDTCHGLEASLADESFGPGDTLSGNLSTAAAASGDPPAHV